MNSFKPRFVQQCRASVLGLLSLITISNQALAVDDAQVVNRRDLSVNAAVSPYLAQPNAGRATAVPINSELVPQGPAPFDPTLASDTAFATAFPLADRDSLKRMPYPYRFLTRNIFNFDKLMRNLLKLEPVDCEFTPTIRPDKRAVYDGVGACLYRNILSGLRYQGVPGTIRSHVRQMTTQQIAEIQIEWRPAPSKTSQALKTVWRSIRGVIHPFQDVPQSAPTLGQLLNVIVLRFKSDADARVIFGDTIFDSIIKEEDGPIRQVVVQFTPGNEDPKRATDAMILFYQGTKTDPVYSLLVQTTFSLFDTKKPMDLSLQGSAP